MEDSGILQLLEQRSEAGISELDKKYGAYCSSIAYRILQQQEDSEECVSDTWLRIWEAVPPMKPKNLRTFAGKITRNLALNRLRQQQTRKRGGWVVTESLEELKECIPGGTPVEDKLEEKRLGESINRFLSGLSEEKRVAFVLRYWYLYPISQVAWKLGTSEGKVKTMLFRLRKQLKIHLEREGIQI